MNILLVGDVVGAPGRRALRELLPRLRRQHGIDFCVVNGENAAGGRGITRAVFRELCDTGADVVTLGDHAWDQDEIAGVIDGESQLLRPANTQAGQPGRGHVVCVAPGGVKVGVLNLIGRVYMPPSDCPFAAAERILGLWPAHQVPVIVVDFHAEATSEKIALGRFLDGRVSAVAGTHTHVQTADEAVLPGGTAYITDLGMTGPMDSVLGREVSAVLRRFVSGMPTRLPVAKADIRLHGLLVDVDETSGRARTARRIAEPLAEAGS